MVAATATVARMPHLLDGVVSAQISPLPYPHLVVQPVLPADIYERLNAEFPSLAFILNGRIDYGNNEAVRLCAKQVLDDRRISTLWRDFFAFHTSADYWHNIVTLFGPYFRTAFPGLEMRMGRRFEDWRVIPRGFSGEAEVRLDCQFVMNTPVIQRSSVKTPHIDVCDKIFSGLFYFRDPADEVGGGDLNIYAWKRAPRFIKHRAMERDIALSETVRYSANTYLCFVNSQQSVHGVSPRDVTTFPRRYINLIAELPLNVFRPRQLNKLQRVLHASDVRAAMNEERY
ncbi:MAG: hypothetical protein ABWY00_00075 [Dongiaceae bacterium]